MSEFGGVVDNLKAAGRLALMLPVRREAFRVNLGQAIALLAIGFVAYGATEFLLTESPLLSITLATAV